MLINAVAQEILVLVSRIRKDRKKIKDNNVTLAGKLYSLREAIDDDGYDIVRNHIDGTTKQIDDTQETFENILRKMTEYATLLQDSDQKVRELTR
jgi:methyl-accepting chemotaxis protein